MGVKRGEVLSWIAKGTGRRWGTMTDIGFGGKHDQIKYMKKFSEIDNHHKSQYN